MLWDSKLWKGDKSMTEAEGNRPERSPVPESELDPKQYNNFMVPPVFLEQYEKIAPGTAEQVVKIWQAEQAQRHQLQSDRAQLHQKVVEARIQDARQVRRETRLVQILGFVLAVVSVCGGVFTAIFGSAIAGEVIGSAGVLGFVAVFIAGRRLSQEPSRLDINENRY